MQLSLGVIILVGVNVLWIVDARAHSKEDGRFAEVENLHKKNSERFKSLTKFLTDEDLSIDGKTSTIGLTIGKYFGGYYQNKDVMSTVGDTLSPPSGEDNHYFDLIKGNVEEVVGDYINQQNMNSIMVYKNDLATLLMRYHDAPLESSNYPDRNMMANSLSTSIIANRFLIEAVERPQSMILHYSDIASIHLMVLQDVAVTYSNSEFISRWWQDLDDQLDHYIDYGHMLQNSVVDWRNDMVECTFHAASTGCTMWEWAGKVCYDKWVLNDKVWKSSDTCTELHGDHTCDDHCQAYQVAMNREVVMWIWEYMGKALSAWEELKVQSGQMAAMAQDFYKRQ